MFAPWILISARNSGTRKRQDKTAVITMVVGYLDRCNGSLRRDLHLECAVASGDRLASLRGYLNARQRSAADEIDTAADRLNPPIRNINTVSTAAFYDRKTPWVVPICCLTGLSSRFQSPIISSGDHSRELKISCRQSRPIHKNRVIRKIG